MEDDIPLFEASVLEEIDFSKCHGEYKPAISNKNPGSNLHLRPLSTGDFERGYLKLLTHLTKVGEISKKQFLERFNSMKASPGGYYIIVLENTETEEVIASASLVVEFKFIHNAGARGRVEDVVVSKDYRGKQLERIRILGC